MAESKNMLDVLADICEEQIFSQTDEELKAKYSVDDLSETSEYISAKSAVDRALLSAKKARFKQISSEAARASSESEISTRNHNIESIREYFVNLLVSGKLPADMTMAFRDGGDIPDEELISMLEDLKELGFDVNE